MFNCIQTGGNTFCSYVQIACVKLSCSLSDHCDPPVLEHGRLMQD